MIACGALGGHIREITARRGWTVELHCLPSLLHNHPGQIAPAAEQLARDNVLDQCEFVHAGLVAGLLVLGSEGF